MEQLKHIGENRYVLRKLSSLRKFTLYIIPKLKKLSMKKGCIR